jgi:hypothetical protein
MGGQGEQAQQDRQVVHGDAPVWPRSHVKQNERPSVSTGRTS